MNTTQAAGLADAIQGLAWLFGPGAAAAILIAWIGSRKPSTIPDPSKPVAGIQALLADHMSMQQFTDQVRRLSENVQRLADGLDKHNTRAEVQQEIDRLRSSKPRG